MTARQRRILVEAFALLVSGAQKGKVIARAGTLDAVRAHVTDLRAMLDELSRTLDEAASRR